MVHTTVPVKANYQDFRDHLRHLGPSNPASNPKSTKVSAVKIKPGARTPRTEAAAIDVIHENPIGIDGVNERTSLLRSQKDGKDGIQALHQSYTNPSNGAPELPGSVQPKVVINADDVAVSEENTSPTASTNSVGSLPSQQGKRISTRYARSGSITENVVEAGGVRKVVLEATSSSDGEGGSSSRTQLLAPVQGSDEDQSDPGASNAASGQGHAKKKNRKKKKKGGKW
jgi:metal transporter CNNM